MRLQGYLKAEQLSTENRFGFFLSIIAIALAMVLPIFKGYAAANDEPTLTTEKSEEEMSEAELKALYEKKWAATGISLQTILDKSVLNECYHTKVKLAGCIGLINVLARSAQSPAQLYNLLQSNAAGDRLTSQFERSVPINRTGWNLGLIKKTKKDKKKSSNSESEESAGPGVKPPATLAEFKKQMADDRAAFDKSLDLLLQNRDINFTKLFIDFASSLDRNESTEPVVASEAINAFLAAAYSPHTRVALKAEFKDSVKKGAQKEWIGIGVELNPRDTGNTSSGIIISRVIPGGAAEVGGIQVYDKILEIDGDKVSGLTIEGIVRKIRGKEGTVVTLSVDRSGSNLKIPLTRKKITIANFETRPLAVKSAKTQSSSSKSPVQYMIARQFNENLAAKVKEALLSPEGQLSKVTILDLRNNPGGLLNVAVELGGHFLGKKVITEIRPIYAGHPEPLVAEKDAVSTKPLIVLINGGSASASELDAGALQDHGRAWLMGLPTYGKGSVQTELLFPVGKGNPLLFDLRQSSSSSLSILFTTALFYQPNGGTNQLRGIQPDFEVSVAPDAKAEDSFAMREEDLYGVIPVKNPPATAVSVERSNQKLALAQCMKSTGSASQVFSKKGDWMKSDYQLLNALDLASCLIQ